MKCHATITSSTWEYISLFPSMCAWASLYIKIIEPLKEFKTTKIVTTGWLRRVKISGI